MPTDIHRSITAKAVRVAIYSSDAGHLTHIIA